MTEPMTAFAANLQWMRECGQPGAYERLQENLRRAEVEEPLHRQQEAARRQAEFDAAVDARIDARLRELGLLDKQAATDACRAVPRLEAAEKRASHKVKVCCCPKVTEVGSVASATDGGNA